MRSSIGKQVQCRTQPFFGPIKMNQVDGFTESSKKCSVGCLRRTPWGYPNFCANADFRPFQYRLYSAIKSTIVLQPLTFLPVGSMLK